MRRSKIGLVITRVLLRSTVVSSRLQKHLSVCPDRPELVNQAPRINSVTDSALSLRSTCLPPIHSIADEIFRFIKKLETLDCRLGLNQCLSDLHVVQSDFVPVISVALHNPRHWSVNGFPGLLLNKFDNLTVADEQKTHTDLRKPAKLVDSSVNVSIPDSHGSKRHIYQNGCLLNILKSEQLLSSEFAYVEFGAGRGGLSHWLNLCLSSEQYENPDALEKEVSWIAKPIDTNFILVELKSTRNKFDIRHRDAGNFIRLRMDIAQLKLNEVSALKAEKKPIVAIAKHLCGDATDLALRCLKNAVTTTDSVGNKTRISGLMLAVCCHHQCSWEETVGRPWLERDAGVTAREFAIAARLSSWATCGFRVRQTDESRPVNNGVGKSNEEPSKAAHKATQPSPFACISPQKRTLIGRTCKRLIDWGRLCFVRNELQFADAKLLPYTSTNVTAENVVMVARTDETNN
ncbi:Coiled-coil domain-containing protein 76 [Fasciola gigantica]|uniref:tRNA:m(4)X modification enzyme TRM13 n=1 Tax=Fasciola gigantica TaxID=46835 RepID=A0A504Z5H5_FASGI|nr:Coiled-coil domain-containing protein 76 [Fasciola gigantica]